MTAASPHIVIVGAGFGGLACAQALGNSGAQVTVIDRHNYHLFVPLLYQVATAALSPADVARPIRRILGRYRNIRIRLGEVAGVDAEKKTLHIPSGDTLSYDTLVIATGSHYSYFGHPEWSRYAKGPRTLDEARYIRARLLTAFERAEMSTDPAEQDALMTTIIVGGGPTGVEMAGSVAELARHALARDFRHIDPRRARILLVEAGPRLLSSFPEELSDYARKAIQSLGVTVMTNKAVENVDEDGATIDGAYVRAGLVIWGAGVEASPAGQWLPVERDRAGRIPVDEYLAVKGVRDVYALGDVALTMQDGKPLPVLAQVAKQQGEYLGAALAGKLEGQAPAPFRFSNRGDTAIIGRHAAVFDFGRFHLKGRIAWVLWAIVHVYLLVGFENRLAIVTHWVWRYFTYERGARLIMEEREEKSRSASS